ncbi:MAG TPA: alpha/beta fold hydrolase [Terriglobales bacterium]|nr:alpha/beta fold hydrolase [Terriglobales bacterium]
MDAVALFPAAFFHLLKLASGLPALISVLTTRAPTGCTPRRLIWSLNKAREYGYEPVLPAEKRHRVPLLLVYAPIGRPAILDLCPGHSFVDWMRRSGFDVFLLDWGYPGPEDQSLGLSGYVQEYLPRAIRKMKSVVRTAEYSMLGWSIGGVFAAIYAALFPNDGLRNLILLTAPLDYSAKHAIALARLVDDRWFALERLLCAFENIPGEMIALGGAATAGPVESFIRPFLQLCDHLDNPEFVRHWQARRTWAADLVPLTGALFRDLVVELYRNDRLMRGELLMGNRHVDLGLIRANLLNVIATDDYVSPPCQSEGLLRVVGSSDKQDLRVPGTHVDSMAGIKAPQNTWPSIQAWLAGRSD